MKFNFNWIGSSIAAYLLWWRDEIKRKSVRQRIRSVIYSLIIIVVISPILYKSIKILKLWNTIPIYECDIAAYNAMTQQDTCSHIRYKMGLFNGSILLDSTLSTATTCAFDTLFYELKNLSLGEGKVHLSTYLGDTLYWGNDSVIPICNADSVISLYYIGQVRSFSIISDMESSIKVINDRLIDMSARHNSGIISAANHSALRNTPIAKTYFPRKITSNSVCKDCIFWSPDLVFVIGKMVCASSNLNKKGWQNIVVGKDISQAYIKIKVSSNIKNFDFDIDFSGVASCSPIYPEPDYMDCKSIKFDNITEKNMPNEGLLIHAKFPEQENIQTMRWFLMTIVITLLVTLYIRQLLILIGSICCIILQLGYFRKKSFVAKI